MVAENTADKMAAKFEDIYVVDKEVGMKAGVDLGPILRADGKDPRAGEYRDRHEHQRLLPFPLLALRVSRCCFILSQG